MICIDWIAVKNNTVCPQINMIIVLKLKPKSSSEIEA